MLATPGSQILAVGALIVGALGGSVFLPGKHITVHDLYYDGEMMVQDRTVRADAEFFWAHWEAQIIDAQTGDVVCEGGGSYPYPTGRKKARLDIPIWVGQPDCVLPPGTYTPRAAWLWGEDQEAVTGAPFTIE